MTAVLPSPGARQPLPHGATSLREFRFVDHDVLQSRARLAALHGRSGVAPFIASPDVHVIDLLDGLGASGYAQQGRWAVAPGEPIAPPNMLQAALDEYLREIARRRLRAAFMAVSNPEPFQQLGMSVSEVADEALIDLPEFTLAGPARANVRHSVSSARRHGLTFAPYSPRMAGQLREISRLWLATKRGGELGFTLSRHDNVTDQLGYGGTDLWTVLDANGDVQAWCTWRHYLGGRARVIDVMRRRPDAPNPAMDFLIASSLETYRAQGVELASLASVPRSYGDMAERIYPTKTLRAYKEKFAPRWEPRWLAVPKSRHTPFVMMAISRAYCPGGLRRAILRNG